VADARLVESALHDLRNQPPALIIDSARYGPSDTHEYDRSGFDRFLTDRYEYLGKMYYADVYRLKEKTHPAILQEGH